MLCCFFYLWHISSSSIILCVSWDLLKTGSKSYEIFEFPFLEFGFLMILYMNKYNFSKWSLFSGMSIRYQKNIWKLVKILLALIIFYTMNTDNNTLLKLLSAKFQSLRRWKIFQLWTCFVIKPLFEIKICVMRHYQYSFCKK